MNVADGSALLALDNDKAVALAESLRASPPDGFIDAIVGAQSLLVLFDPARFDLRALEARPAARTQPSRTVRLQALYDGADLAALSARLGFDAAREHAAREHVVRFLGFAPGFAYCSGGFDLERLATPRTRVPAGSIAVAAGYTGIYPRESPGGWWLIGRIAERLSADWVRPGDRVVFEPVPALPTMPPEEPAPHDARLRIVRGGAVYTRCPMDYAALAQANALLGNPPLAPAYECLLASPRLEALADVRVAFAGEVHALRRGDVLAPRRTSLFRDYLAIESPRDAHVSPGARVLAGATPLPRSLADATPLPRALPPPAVTSDPVLLRALPGPQSARAAADALYTNEWRLSPRSDRGGARLAGPPLKLFAAPDIPPEGTQFGAVQLPAGGQPIILGPDRPRTGGYAKIALVLWDDLPKLAQARPGARIRFVRP